MKKLIPTLKTSLVVDISELMKLVPDSVSREVDNFFCEYSGNDIIDVEEFSAHLKQEYKTWNEVQDMPCKYSDFQPILKWLKVNKVNHISLWTNIEPSS